MATFDGPQINEYGNLMENIRILKNYMDDLADQLNFHITRLENENKSLKEEIEKMKED